MATNWITRTVGLAAVFLAACGGGGTGAPPDAGPWRAPGPQRAASLDAATLMDWAEREYAQYFPGHPGTGTITVGPDTYTYRAYDAGNGRTAYLGVTTQGRVDVWSPLLNGGNLWSVGTLDGFACRVLGQNCGSSVSGTAAAGAPIAGATITLKDSTGKTGTATTGATGAFTVDTSGMTAPFVLRASLPSGSDLFSVSAGGGATAVVNVTPLTDVIVRSWYGVQGLAPATAFANLAGAPAPNATQVRSIAQTLLQTMQISLDATSAGIGDALDLIAKPFVADHQGLDLLLDNTRVTVAPETLTLVMTGSTVNQTVTLALDRATSGMTASSTAASGGNTTTVALASSVPVKAADATALDEIQAQLASLASVVASKGTSLTTTDVIGFFAPDFLDQGRDRNLFAASMARELPGTAPFALTVLRVRRLDSAAGTAELELRVTQGAANEVNPFAFKKGATWQFFGDQRPGEMGVKAEARRNQGRFAGSSGPSINMDVRLPKGAYTGARISGAGTTYTLARDSHTVIDEDGRELDAFVFNTGVLGPPLPVAGTVFTITLTKADGSTVAFSEPLNAFTTEQIQVTSPVGMGLADAHLGGTLTVSWTRPGTYPVVSVHVGATVWTANFECTVEHNDVAATASSTTLAMPTTCNGEPIARVNVGVSTIGPNGERSQVLHTMDDRP